MQLAPGCTALVPGRARNRRLAGTRAALQAYPHHRGSSTCVRQIPHGSPRPSSRLGRAVPLVSLSLHTSARAGRTPSGCPAPRPGAVHPRWCGAVTRFADAVTVKRGSSPRVRGSSNPSFRVVETDDGGGFGTGPSTGSLACRSALPLFLLRSARSRPAGAFSRLVAQRQDRRLATGVQGVVAFVEDAARA